ncbi:MAG: 3-hydroxybutyryl-CoA dehydrogenase [Deltaproteobacteria bacterium]|nr:3-hydroxybutyryl-CoA dehydrogenase [Deltaproteobacteria bacterium]
MKIQKVGVVGAGIMGSGIAQVFAMNGFDVVLHDISEERVQKGKSAIEKSLGKFVEKGKITAEVSQAIVGRISTTVSLESFADCDLVVEAASEDIKLKKELFQQLDRIVSKTAILASNTSSIPIGTLAAATSRPAQVIGMHFMNPPPLMRGVEVIRSDATSDATDRAVVELVKQLGKSPVRSRDRTGFVANRILIPMIREAILALEEGVAERDDIDRCMVDCCNFPMGPLALADLIGLDTCQSIMKVMADGLKNERYRPPQLLNTMVKDGKLGRKTREGFYDYRS